MLVLKAPSPTPEQLRIIGDTRVGVEVIRGAAGSGKTTTALLRLRNLSDMFRARHSRLGLAHPVNALVLTYNRTLRGYVEVLAEEQAAEGGGVTIEVETYAKWARDLAGQPDMVGDRHTSLSQLAQWREVRLPPDFLNSEVEYVMGRFRPDRLSDYLEAERTGRGNSPRVDRHTRERIVALITAYREYIDDRGLWDWEDLPSAVATMASQQYEIVVVDEAQDFSANQLRSIMPHLSRAHSLTLVLDTAQRLYPRGYTWSEAGVTVRSFYRLEQNHRNTIEIATFVRGLISGLSLDDDGTIPDLSKANKHGGKPAVLRGKYSRQLEYAVTFLRNQVDLRKETVAFLHPLGGRWFDAIRERLAKERIPYHDISRAREWPQDDTNVVLSTMHSAKGLEFDHVLILGLNDEVTRHGEDAEDDQLLTLRRLLAMAVARARASVIVGYKDSDASALVGYFEAGTFDEIAVSAT